MGINICKAAPSKVPLWKHKTFDYGSTGIMLLDFVGARESHGLTVYGDLLPQTIINNNYKYRMNRRGE